MGTLENFDPATDWADNDDSDEGEPGAGSGEDEGGKVGKGEPVIESIGVFLDVRYIRGGEAEYLREGSIEIDDGRVHYDVRHSRTDIVIVRIGLSFLVM